MEYLKKKVFSYSRNSTVFLRSLQVGELKTYLLARFRLYWIANLLRHSFVWNNFFNFWGCVFRRKHVDQYHIWDDKTRAVYSFA